MCFADKSCTSSAFCPLFCIPPLRVLCQAKNRLPLSRCCLSKPFFTSTLPRLCIAANGRVLPLPRPAPGRTGQTKPAGILSRPGPSAAAFTPTLTRRPAQVWAYRAFSGGHFPSDLYCAVIYKRIIFPACATSNIFNTNISNYPPVDWKSSFCNPNTVRYHLPACHRLTVGAV